MVFIPNRKFKGNKNSLKQKKSLTKAISKKVKKAHNKKIKKTSNVKKGKKVQKSSLVGKGGEKQDQNTHILPAHVILKKRKGEALNEAEIRYFIDGLTKGTLPEY